MYEVAQEPADARFHTAWQAAGQHLQRLGANAISWIRADLNPPLAEHLAFRLGNQLIFIYLQVADGVQSPSSKQLFLTVCKEATAVAAVMPMEPSGQSFQPTYGGWGLRDAVTHAPIDPPSLVSDAKIEMSDWEVHDFAIQIVTSQIESAGNTILSKQPSPHIDPSIWFKDRQGPAFVVVRCGRYPFSDAPKPTNINEIAASCARLSQRGFFASVTAANAEQQAAPVSRGSIPLFRGHGLVARFTGLVPLR